MEVIQTVFDQLQADIQQKLKVLEKQVVFILASNQNTQAPPEEFLLIRATMDTIAKKLDNFESRLNTLERNNVRVASPVMNVTSAGLEGLLMKPIALPSPALSARSENQVVLPTIQRQIIIPEVEEVEPDEDALRGVVAEETGGIDEEEAAEEEEQEEEQEEEEEEVDEGDQGDDEAEEEAETVELEEFIWKGKTYFKTPDHMVYRANDEGDVEDEPFAKYDPKTNTLKRI